MAKASITPTLKNALKARFECCAACGTWDANEAGHLVAETNGGSLDLDNLVLLCHACNRTMATVTVKFAAFAEYTESRKTIEERREYFAKYCRAARGSQKIKDYAPR